MKSFLLGAFLSAGLFLPAVADSLDDFNKGVAASNRDDDDAAIQYLSAALSSSDLLPSLRPTAYFDRALAYIDTQRVADAIADLSAAIKLDPKLSDAYVYRIRLYFANGQTDLALADCVSAPVPARFSGVLEQCGRWLWTHGRFSEAASDFARAVKLKLARSDPQAAYAVLWLELSRLRDGTVDEAEFVENVRRIDLDGWPKPVLELYRGKTTPEAVAAAAAQGNAAAQKDQSCEMGFYVGEWQLLHGNAAAAKSLLTEAANVCPKTFIELAPAQAELKKLQ